MLYFAYGSNMMLDQMRRRCPDSVPVRPVMVDDCQLIFRGVADVAWREGSVCPGALYDITDRCERSLDGFEGVSSRTYLKRYMDVKIGKKKHECLYYQMPITRGIMPPSEEYIGRIAQGYKDWDLDMEPLRDALDRSWKDKDITQRMAQRWVDRGRPKLAKVKT